MFTNYVEEIKLPLSPTDVSDFVYLGDLLGWVTPKELYFTKNDELQFSVKFLKPEN